MLEDDHWVRRVCVARLPDESVEGLESRVLLCQGG